MAMKTGARADGVCADINVTPFADIMIVLLIIFMVATAAMDKDDRLRLPAAAHSRETQESPHVVRLTRGGAVLLGETTMIDCGMLEMMLKERLASGEARLVQLQADGALEYARVAPVLAAIRSAGAAQIVLRTQPSAQTKRKP